MKTDLAEYDMYLEREWEISQRRYQHGQGSFMRGIGWGLLLSSAIWAVLYLAGSWIWSNLP